MLNARREVTYCNHASFGGQLLQSVYLDLLKFWACWVLLSDANSQLNRVISAASGADWRTLRDLEKLLSQMFPGEGDTQTAISARLREISPVRHGLLKQVRTVRNEDISANDSGICS